MGFYKYLVEAYKYIFHCEFTNDITKTAFCFSELWLMIYVLIVLLIIKTYVY